MSNDERDRHRGSFGIDVYDEDPDAPTPGKKPYSAPRVIESRPATAMDWQEMPLPEPPAGLPRSLVALPGHALCIAGIEVERDLEGDWDHDLSDYDPDLAHLGYNCVQRPFELRGIAFAGGFLEPQPEHEIIVTAIKVGVRSLALATTEGVPLSTLRAAFSVVPMLITPGYELRVQFKVPLPKAFRLCVGFYGLAIEP